jgi:hypothetical protein
MIFLDIIESQSKSDSEEIVGKSRVTAIRAKDKKRWVWEYGFDANGVVRWRDPLNNQNGAGKWSLTPQQPLVQIQQSCVPKRIW